MNLPRLVTLSKRIQNWMKAHGDGNSTRAEHDWDRVLNDIRRLMRKEPTHISEEVYTKFWKMYADESKLTMGQLRKKWGNQYGMPLDRNGFPDIGF